MTTTKHVKKVPDLSGPALDWAVAKCEQGGALPAGFNPRYALPYSSDWSLAGPIIERERMCIDYDTRNGLPRWLSSSRSDEKGNLYTGSTPLEAAMRSHVACKLGDIVEIPEELV